MTSTPNLGPTHLEARINDLLEKMGYPSGKGSEWWVNLAHQELGGQTAMQAWQQGHHEQVLGLVEAYVSKQFAQALSAKPSVAGRLLAN